MLAILLILYGFIRLILCGRLSISGKLYCAYSKIIRLFYDFVHKFYVVGGAS